MQPPTCAGTPGEARSPRERGSGGREAQGLWGWAEAGYGAQHRFCGCPGDSSTCPPPGLAPRFPWAELSIYVPRTGYTLALLPHCTSGVERSPALPGECWCNTRSKKQPWQHPQRGEGFAPRMPRKGWVGVPRLRAGGWQGWGPGALWPGIWCLQLHWGGFKPPTAPKRGLYSPFRPSCLLLHKKGTFILVYCCATLPPLSPFLCPHPPPPPEKKTIWKFDV